MLFGTTRKILGQASANFGIELFSRQGVKEATLQALDDTKRWNKRDCPLNPLMMVWLVLAMTLHRSLSIANVFRRLVALLQESEPDLASRPVTDEAVLHARMRLGPEPFRHLFEKLARRGQKTTQYRGYRVWGIDGVELTLPDTARNLKVFPRIDGSRGPAAFPTLKAVCLVNTKTRRVRDVRAAERDHPERDHLQELVNDNLGTGELLILDRGLSAHWVFSLLHERDVDFLVRIPVYWKMKLAERLREGDYLVEFRNCGRRQRELVQRGLNPDCSPRLRMLTYRVGSGETVSLLTSLTDSVRFPARELALLYHQRWECELAYDEMKNHLATVCHGKQRTIFRSKRPEGVLQELYAMLVVYNLVRELMADTAEQLEISPLELSFTDILQIIAIWIPRIQAVHGQRRKQQYWARFRRSLCLCRLGRPRRPRQWPRKVKRKMSTFGKKRATDGERALDYQRELDLVEVSL